MSKHNMESLDILIGSVRTGELGEVWVAVSERGLITVEFGVCREEFEASVQKQVRRAGARVREQEAPAVREAICQIEEYLQGERHVFDMAIDWSILGSDFQRRALQAVMAIPYGETRTYGEIAAQIGTPNAPRAVGRANATNPMPLVIPCHRVIGTDGKLHGYGGAGGLKTKRWLLRMEGGGA
jgi:methylated-DNA-[protein]-cysteine S-methyltransferase